MREIASQLQTKKPGFYFIVSSSGERLNFLANLAPQFSSSMSLKQFSIWLKDTFGLRGGGSETNLQGGGTHIDPKLDTAIKEWLENQK